MSHKMLHAILQMLGVWHIYFEHFSDVVTELQQQNGIELWLLTARSSR